MGFRNTLFAGLLTIVGLGMPQNLFAKSEKEVYRNYAGLSVNRSNLTVNENDYALGVSLGAYGNINIPVSDWLLLNPKFNSSYSSLGVLEENAVEELIDTNFSLEGLIDLYSSNGSKFYFGIGAEYLLNNEKMIYEGTDGYLKRQSIGPILTLGLFSPKIDLSLSVSELFGHKTSSFDRKRLIRANHIVFSATPRGKPIEIHTRLELLHWTIADFPKDRNDLLVKFVFQPGVDISSHLTLFPNFSYTYVFGTDEYFNGEVGLGARVKW